jgi:hypothetical protein
MIEKPGRHRSRETAGQHEHVARSVLACLQASKQRLYNSCCGVIEANNPIEKQKPGYQHEIGVAAGPDRSEPRTLLTSDSTGTTRFMPYTQCGTRCCSHIPGGKA